MEDFVLKKYELELDKHGLTRGERRAVDRVARSIGYPGGIDELITIHNYNSALEIAEEASFQSVRDYFLADGWHQRVSDFNRNGNFNKD